MAVCPQCRKPVSPLVLLLDISWTTIHCRNCKSKLYIRGKDFFIWYLPLVVIFFLLGLLIIKKTNIKSSTLGIIVTLLSACGYFIFGWYFTRLEIAK